jgi:hypothetical protein
VKIGIARDVARRLSQLQSASPATLALVVAFPGDAATESAIHWRFAADRIRGEWFRESPELAAWIARQREATEGP